MKKRDALRAWLEAAIPALKADASRFLVFTEKGSLHSTGAVTPAGVVAYEWRYSAIFLFLDLAGDPDAVALAVFAWLARHEPALLQNYQRNGRGLTFECDVLDGGKVDLEITVDLTDAVLWKPRAGGGFDKEHVQEPPLAGVEIWPGLADAPPAATEIWADDELIATLPGG